MKNLLFGFIASVMFLALAFVIVNIGSFAFLKSRRNLDMFDPASFSAYLENKISKKGFAKPTIVHPFFGKMQLGDVLFSSELSQEPLFNRIDGPTTGDTVKVLILGGSVSMGLSTDGSGGIFARKLSEVFGPGKFTVYNAGIGGGKQPTQYFKAVYLDLLGFHPDIVINVDGYNEVALPLTENFALKNPAIFPRYFSAHIETSTNSTHGCMEEAEPRLKAGSRLPVQALYADLRYDYCKSLFERLETPWWAKIFPEEKLDEVVRQTHSIWRESSNKLFDFLAQQDIDYIHVLQPNQYLDGSKPLSDEERSYALSNEIYGKWIRKYYNILSQDGLKTPHFYDQRLLFQTTRETVYKDSCCHFTERGDETISSDIIQRFKDIFEKRLSAKR